MLSCKHAAGIDIFVEVFANTFFECSAEVRGTQPDGFCRFGKRDRVRDMLVDIGDRVFNCLLSFRWTGIFFGLFHLLGLLCDVLADFVERIGILGKQTLHAKRRKKRLKPF